VKVDKEEKLEKEELSKTGYNFSEVRVQLNGLILSESLLIESPVYLYNQEIKIALIKTGNKINCFRNNGNASLTINGETFDGEKFSYIKWH
jgi:hypothetical protein